jgi:hypothetical protein
MALPPAPSPLLAEEPETVGQILHPQSFFQISISHFAWKRLTW